MLPPLTLIYTVPSGSTLRVMPLPPAFTMSLTLNAVRNLPVPSPRMPYTPIVFGFGPFRFVLQYTATRSPGRGSTRASPGFQVLPPPPPPPPHDGTVTVNGEVVPSNIVPETTVPPARLIV